jgi:hypothetical protein
MTEQGVTTIIDTLADSNGTLAVLQLEGMRPNPSTYSASRRHMCDAGVAIDGSNSSRFHLAAQSVSIDSLDKLERLLRRRRTFLQQRAIESRETQLLLGSLMLKWGVDRNVVLDICHDLSPASGGRPRLSSFSESIVSSSSSNQEIDTHVSSKRPDGQARVHHFENSPIRSSNQPIERQQQAESVDDAGDVRGVASVASAVTASAAAGKDAAHIQTVRSLHFVTVIKTKHNSLIDTVIHK